MEENRVEITAGVGREDYISLYYICSCAFTQLKWYIAIAIILLFDIVAVIITIFPRVRGDLGFGTSLVFTLLFIAVTVYMLFYPRLYRRLARKTVTAKYAAGTLADVEKRYVFDYNGIFIDSGSQQYAFRWDQVLAIKEDPLVYVVCFKEFDNTCLIPKRYVDEEFCARLRGYLQGRGFILYP